MWYGSKVPQVSALNPFWGFYCVNTHRAVRPWATVFYQTRQAIGEQHGSALLWLYMLYSLFWPPPRRFDDGHQLHLAVILDPLQQVSLEMLLKCKSRYQSGTV